MPTCFMAAETSIGNRLNFALMMFVGPILGNSSQYGQDPSAKACGPFQSCIRVVSIAVGVDQFK